MTSRSLDISLGVLCLAALTGPALAEQTSASASTATAPTPAPNIDAVRSRLDVLVDALVGALPTDPSGDRSRLAVLPLHAADAPSREHRLGLVASEMLASSLAERHALTQVERLQLEGILGELQWSQSAAVDETRSVAIGRLLGATRVLVGTVASAPNAFVVFARIIDVESGEVLSGSSAEIPRITLLTLADDVVEIRSTSGAVARSAILPGWGQVYNDDIFRGVTYSLLFSGAGVTAAVFGLLGSQAEERYQQNTRDTVGERAQANAYYDNAEYALLGMAGIWAVAIVDAAITGRDVTEIDRARLRVSPGGVAWRF